MPRRPRPESGNSLAVDGWWMARLLNLAPPADDLHRQVRARPAAMIEEDA